MEYIQITGTNLDTEHICCAISNNNDPQVASKKSWLRDRLTEGLVFLKADERGKCFIEYLPAEAAWVPVRADNYMLINCFWVSGRFKGNGYADDLLERCISDSKAKGKDGLCMISSRKKKAFLADPKYLAYKGFMTADAADPDYLLCYLPFSDTAVKPEFMPHAKSPQIGEADGYVLYYTSQCPFNAKYVPLLERAANQSGVPFKAVHLQSREEAQAVPVAVTTFALFENGKYLTNEILSEKKFVKLISTREDRRQA